jgi:hypothetical protein
MNRFNSEQSAAKDGKQLGGFYKANIPHEIH